MILLVDNYDSFTYNLYQALAISGAEVVVYRNDAASVAELLDLRPERVVLSPGPGRPRDAGVCLELLASLPPKVPLLGVCLGHQALVESLGGELEIDRAPVHGKASQVFHDGRGLFAELPSPLECGRYHSLRAAAETLPPALERSAWTEDGAIMGVRHRERPWHGVQFHPESILTPRGQTMIDRFVHPVRTGV